MKVVHSRMKSFLNQEEENMERRIRLASVLRTLYHPMTPVVSWSTCRALHKQVEIYVHVYGGFNTRHYTLVDGFSCF